MMSYTLHLEDTLRGLYITHVYTYINDTPCGGSTMMSRMEVIDWRSHYQRKRTN